MTATVADDTVDAMFGADEAGGRGEAPADPAPGPAPADEAPYGYRTDGQPKARPGRKPNGQFAGSGSGSGSGSSGRSRGPRAARKTRGRSGGRAAGGPDYREAILGMVQLPCAALAMAAASAKRPEQAVVLAADAAALSIYAPAVADALDQLARENTAVAAILERALTVGPYGAILAAVIPLVLQLAANHRLVPAGMLGTVSAEELAGQLAPPGAP